MSAEDNAERNKQVKAYFEKKGGKKKNETGEQSSIVRYFDNNILPYYSNCILYCNPFSGLSNMHVDPKEYYSIPTRTGKITKMQSLMKRAYAQGFKKSNPDLTFRQKMTHKTIALVAYDGSVTISELEADLEFTGLSIELKATGKRVYKNDGSFYKGRETDHRAQLKVLQSLRVQGEWADFVIGQHAAKKIINWYFKIG